MLNFLGNNRTVVGIAITQNIGLEVGVIDKKTSQVLKYASRPLEYNIASREIDNYTLFKQLLEEIYEELGIGIKNDVYVVLPNVHFDFTNLPITSMSNGAIAEHILNKIEESNYIFRRVDPLTDWDDINFRNRTDSRYVVHSSLQAQACEKIRDIIHEMGGNLIGIEGAYTAILRGIDFSGIAQEYIESNEDWSVLLINSNNYALFSMSSHNLIDYSEFPLALRSFSPEEVYQAIANPISQLLAQQTVKKLVIVSQSDEVNAGILRNSLSYNGEAIILNANKYTDAPIISGTQDNAMSLSLIGACTSEFSKFPLKLNVLFPKEGGAGDEIEIAGSIYSLDSIIKISAYTLGILTVLGLVIVLGAGGLRNYFVERNDKLTSEINQVQAEITKLNSDNKVNINKLLNDIIAQNLKTLSFYDSLAIDIPKTVWLSHFASKNGNDIFVEGMSTKIRDVYEYYKSLKLLVPSSNVTLSKLKMVSNLFETDYTLDNLKDDIKLYSFSIGNDFASAAPPQGDQAANGNSAPQNNQNNAQPAQNQTQINNSGGNVDSTPPDVNLQPINDDMFN